MSSKAEKFLERVSNGNSLVVAEGYLFEFERRGYLKAGAFVPDVVLNKPHLVKAMHEEFVHAGSDVVLAFTYYGHREKLRLIGKEDQLEALNRKALSIAAEVAKETGALLAGNICNTTVFRRDNEEAKTRVRAMFKEQVEWAVEAGVDYILGETFSELGEAMLALHAIQEYGNGTPAVITLVPAKANTTFDGVPLSEACRKLEDAGAAVVGLNCGRGVETIMPLMEEIRAACEGPIACVPVPYVTTDTCPTMHSLKDAKTGAGAFPVDLDAHLYGRTAIAEFGRRCKELGVEYVGICCGNCGHYTRTLAEAYGRTPPASKYSPDMSQHFFLGNQKKTGSDYRDTYINFKN